MHHHISTEPLEWSQPVTERTSFATLPQQFAIYQIRNSSRAEMTTNEN